jgi:hypothetical protein
MTADNGFFSQRRAQEAFWEHPLVVRLEKSARCIFLCRQYEQAGEARVTNACQVGLLQEVQRLNSISDRTLALKKEEQRSSRAAIVIIASMPKR